MAFNTIILSQNSKVKAIDYNLGSLYSTAWTYVQFRFTKIPDSVKTNMDLAMHTINSGLPGQPTCSSSTSQLSATLNLMEEAKKERASLAERASFVSLEDADRISKLISDRFDVEVKVGRINNPEGHRIMNEYRMDVNARKFSEAFCNTLSEALTKHLPLRKGCEPSASEEIVQPEPELAPPVLTEDQKFLAQDIKIRSISVFSHVLGLLNEEGYISGDEVEALLPLVKKIDALLKERVAITKVLSPEHINALRQYFDYPVATLIDKCETLITSKDVLGDVTWAKLEEPLNPRNIAFAALVECASGHVPTVIMENFGGLKDVTEAAEQLNNIYRGNTGMESLLKEYGMSVPSLELQREVLFDFIEEKVAERFGPEDTSMIPVDFDVEVVKKVRRRLFADTYNLKMIEINFDTMYLSVNSLSGVLDLFQGNFKPYRWRLSGFDGFVEGDEARERFAKMLAEVMEVNNIIR